MSARLVYRSGPGGSGDPGCPRCGATPCRCARVAAASPGEQTVRVRRERGGRKGKTVTVADPLRLGRDDALKLLADLKRDCGAGGTLKTVTVGGCAAFALELQGDHVEAVVERLAVRGFRAKRSGG